MRYDPDEKSKRRRSLKNVKWVGHYLGVSRNTIHQWVMEGHIPYINLGVTGGRRVIRFDPDIIETWLYDRSHSPGQDKKGDGNDSEQIGDDTEPAKS